MSESDSEDPGSKRRWRADAVRLAVGILESEKDYRTVNVLGRGTYGDVFRMYDPSKDSDIAVKIITADNIAEIEITMWPKLKHPNIVPLLELLTLDPIDVAIFVMPVQYKTLHDMLHDRHFINREGCLIYLKAWFYEVLCGLAYLNSKNLCHLDIKVDNILISYSYKAMLCDFSFLNFHTKPIERYDLGLPYIYRPPEACHSLGDKMIIDGVAYDMWGFGVMVVEIFTEFVLATSVTNDKCWYKEVYPTLFKLVQESRFASSMVQAFPGDQINTAQIKLALNFIHVFLKFDPQKRSTPVQAMKHMFLNRGTDLGPVPDPIWIHKGAMKYVLKRVKQIENHQGDNLFEYNAKESTPIEEPEFDNGDVSYITSNKQHNNDQGRSFFQTKNTPCSRRLNLNKNLYAEPCEILGSSTSFISQSSLKDEFNDDMLFENAKTLSLDSMEDLENSDEKDAILDYYEKYPEEKAGSTFEDKLETEEMVDFLHYSNFSPTVQDDDESFKEDNLKYVQGDYFHYSQENLKSHPKRIITSLPEIASVSPSRNTEDECSEESYLPLEESNLPSIHILDNSTPEKNTDATLFPRGDTTSITYSPNNNGSKPQSPSSDKDESGKSLSNSQINLESDEFMDHTSILKQHREALNEVKSLGERLKQLDEKVSSLADIMRCENCSRRQQASCLESQNECSETSTLETREGNETSEESSMKQTSSFIDEEKLDISETAPEILHSERGDQQDIIKSLDKDAIKRSIKTKRTSGIRRNMMKWLHRKQNAIEKMVKSVPYNVLK